MRRLGRTVRVGQVRVRHAHVEPRGVEYRASADDAGHPWKGGVDRHQRAKIELVGLRVEVVKGGKRGEQNVELAPALYSRDRARYVRVAKSQVRRIDDEVGQRTAACRDATRERALPVGGKGLAIQRAQQIEVHRIRLELHVVHGEHGAASFERHRPANPRFGRAHVHVVNDIIQLVQVALVPDVELQRSTARCRERGVHPRDVRHGNAVRDGANSVPHRQITAPHDFPLGGSGGTRQIPVRRREPRAVAEHAGDARDVAPFERRRGLIRVQRVDHEALARRVRIRNADVREKRVRIRPPVRLGQPFARAPNLVILARHVGADRAVASRAAQRIVGVPRNRDAEAPAIPDVHRIQHDEIAKPTFGAFLLRLGGAHSEQAPVIPLPVFVLAQHDRRMFDVHTAEVQPPVHEIARVVPEGHLARGDEQRVLIVSQLERVDRDAREKAPADPADVHRAVNRRLHTGFDRVPHRRLSVLGLRREQRYANDNRPERNEHAQADEGDEVAASHATRRRRLRNQGRSRR